MEGKEQEEKEEEKEVEVVVVEGGARNFEYSLYFAARNRRYVSSDILAPIEGNSPIFASFLTSSRVGLRPSWAAANARSQSLSSCLSFRA